MDKEGSDLLFGFITKVYERRSLIITTNLPFGRWSEVFQDATAAAAVIDRIVHHANFIKTEGESYRLRDAKRRTNPRARKGRTRPPESSSGRRPLRSPLRGSLRRLLPEPSIPSMGVHFHDSATVPFSGSETTRAMAPG